MNDGLHSTAAPGTALPSPVLDARAGRGPEGRALGDDAIGANGVHSSRSNAAITVSPGGRAVASRDVRSARRAGRAASLEVSAANRA